MDDNYERAIGRIEGKLDRLIEDRAESARAQAQFHVSMENIRNRQENAGEKMESLLTRIDKMEKPLADLSRWRERFVGAVMAASFVAAALGGASALFWQKLVHSVEMWI